MAKLFNILLFGVVVFAATVLYGQAGRNRGLPAAKPNEQATPSPSPTPHHPDTISSISNDDGEIIKIDTQLVWVPVRVMDKAGKFVGGLSKENFRVSEDGVEQDIAMFSGEQEPFTVVLLLDMSYSAKFKIADIQAAAIAFIDQLRPQDRVMVVAFDEDVHVLTEATGDRKEIYRAIRSTRIGTGTSIYDAVDLVVNSRLRNIDGRKAVIMFTDGVDTTSRSVNDVQNLSDAMELDAIIYPIEYDTFEDVQTMSRGGTVNTTGPITIRTEGSGPSQIYPRPTPPIPSDSGDSMPFPTPSSGSGTTGAKGTTPAEYQRAAEYLDQLAYRTGGRLYKATSMGNVTDAFTRIASELREFYSIAYYPKQDRVPGKKTFIKVRTDRQGVSVHTREGYLIPKKTKIKGT